MKVIYDGVVYEDFSVDEASELTQRLKVKVKITRQKHAKRILRKWHSLPWTDTEAKMWAGKILEEVGSELPEQYRDKA
jgi:hypothetical protein